MSQAVRTTDWVVFHNSIPYQHNISYVRCSWYGHGIAIYRLVITPPPGAQDMWRDIKCILIYYYLFNRMSLISTVPSVSSIVFTALWWPLLLVFLNMIGLVPTYVNWNSIFRTSTCTLARISCVLRSFIGDTSKWHSAGTAVSTVSWIYAASCDVTDNCNVTWLKTRFQHLI